MSHWWCRKGIRPVKTECCSMLVVIIWLRQGTNDLHVLWVPAVTTANLRDLLLQQDPERYDIPIPVYQSINQSINQQSINHLLLRIYSKQNKLCAWRHVMPPPLYSPCGHCSASRRRADRRACRRQRGSSFPRSIRSHADRCSSCVNAAVSKPAWWQWPLTFWPWKYYPSHVWRVLPVCQFWSS